MSKPHKDSSRRRVLNYIVLNVMVFAAALNTGLNLLFFLGILMSLIFIIAYITGNNNIRKIEIKREIKTEIYEKERVAFQYIVESSSSSNFIEIRDSFPPHAGIIEGAYIPALKAGDKLKNTSYFTFSIPGVFFLDELEISSSFPIAVTSFFRHYSIREKLIVFPEYYNFSRFPDERLEELSENEQFGTRIGTGENIWGIKPYEMGDRIRDIDWKVSSRTDELMVKVREEPRGKRLWVLPVLDNLNRNDSNADIVRLTASIVKNRLDTDSVLGTVIGSRVSLPSGGKGQFYHLLKELSHVWIEGQDRKKVPDLSGFLMTNDIVFIVTNASASRVEPHIFEIRKNRVKVVVVQLSSSHDERREFLESAVVNEYLYFGGDPKRPNEVFDNVHN